MQYVISKTRFNEASTNYKSWFQAVSRQSIEFSLNIWFLLILYNAIYFTVCQAELNQKSTEVDAFKARVLELEQVVAKKDQARTDQKRLLKKVKVSENSGT